MSRESYRGRFVWYELLTTDVDGAKAFYGDLIGWTITPFGTEDNPYDMWTADAPVGGVMKMPDDVLAQGIPSHWTGYVATPDVDAALARGAELGGQIIVPAMDIPEVGRFGGLQDPQGGVIYPYRTSDDDWRPEEGLPAAGHISWHELATTDYKAAWAFYSELFGWTVTSEMDLGGGAMYRMFGHSADAPVGGMYDKPEEAHTGWLYYIRVPDAKAAAARVADLGGTVLNGPMEVPGGDIVAQCLDPQGAAFAVHSTA